MSEMVIVHVANLDGDPSAGAEVAVLNHIRYQSENCRLLLLNCGDYKINSKNRNYEAVNYEEIKNINNLEAPFNHPDVIVFHSIYYPKYLKLAHQARKLNIPYIVIPHGGLQINAQKTKRIKKILGNFFLFNSFLKNAAAIQYLCKAEENNSVNKNKNHFISGNGYEITDVRKKYNSKQYKGLNIIYIGRYDIYFKGLDLLIECIIEIKEYMRSNDIKLSLYGKKNTDYELLMKKIKEYKIEDIVSLNDGVFGKEKKLKLISADVFIQTSRSEGQPLGIIEAISLGLPCIVTKGTNFGEIVENEKIGWVADFTKESIVNSIKEAYIQKEKLPEMSNRAYKYAEENLAWENVSQEALKCYKNVIQQYGKESKKNDK